MIQTEIENNLIDGMELLHLEIENESPNHNVEPGSESHFKVVVVSDEFIEKRLVQRHQMIYRILKEQMTKIHAIAIHAFTKDEWQEKTGQDLNSPNCLGGEN